MLLPDAQLGINPLCMMDESYGGKVAEMQKFRKSPILINETRRQEVRSSSRGSSIVKVGGRHLQQDNQPHQLFFSGVSDKKRHLIEKTINETNPRLQEFGSIDQEVEWEVLPQNAEFRKPKDRSKIRSKGHLMFINQRIRRFDARQQTV